MQKILPYSFYSSVLILFTFGNAMAATCTGDVVFTSITITSISSGNYQYSYEIQNIGTSDIAINQLVIQNYVSTDNQVGSDAAAGGGYIDNGSSDVLAAGATYSGTTGAYPFPANPQSSYPYLIAHIYLSPDTECDNTNNDFIKLVEINTAIQSSLLAEATINWDMENSSFIVSRWSGNNSGLLYNVYSSSGALILSGRTQENEPTPIEGLNKGFYILYLSDGEKLYVKKIVY